MKRMLVFTLLLCYIFLFAVSHVGTTQAQSIAAWQPNTAYSVGSLVSYNGAIYKCI